MNRERGHLTKNPQEAVDALLWIKVVGIGNSGAGKTCLIKHFCESKDADDDPKFSGGYQPTVGVDYGFKIHTINTIDLRVHLWDLSGSPEYIDVRNELYGQCDAIFFVYDITNQASFDSLDIWMKEVVKYGSGNPELVLVANKVDGKSGKRIIATADGKKWALQQKMSYYETSAATGDGVDTFFTELLTAVLKKRKTGMI